ncbi:MAG: histidinol-phosphate transaminase [Candidatus Syntropharchaeia archaeon]
MIKPKPSIECMEEYVPGKQPPEKGMIKLASNENPLGPSPKAVDAIKRASGEVDVYPSSDAFELREAISEYIGFPVERIVAGNGSDGVMDTIARIFIEKDTETMIPIPTFSMYEIVTRAYGGNPRFIRRREDFSVDVEELIANLNKKTKLIFLCSPNNPSGNVIEERDVRKICESTDSLIVIDEAYVEFSDSSLIDLAWDFENLVIVRTFSKAYGLAGLRIGYGIIPEWLSKDYWKAHIPFSVSSIAISAGIAALKDENHLKRTIEVIRTGREFLLSEIPFRTFPSQANFVLVDVSPLRSKEVFSRLFERGIVVRDCSSFRGAGDSLCRITVGKMEENEKVVDALKEIYAGEGI